MSNNNWSSTGSSLISPAAIITSASGYPYTAAGAFVTCAECLTHFTGGLGGGDAESYDEAVVACYANGWYVGKNLKICLDCRKKIDPTDKVDESILSDNN